MSLNDNEKAIFEAVSNMLSQDVKLGLAIHKGPTGLNKTTDHHSQFKWEGINDLFTLKIAKSPFRDAISSAFYSVHSHKYVNCPTFKLSLERELKSRGIPTADIELAFKTIDKIVNDLSESNPSEQDAGWNPAIDEIVDLTSNADNRKAKRSEPFAGGGPAPKDMKK
jgi:hypothetical protein